MKLSPWIIVDGYCATRVIAGSNPSKIENRIAFIEKSPRVRLAAFSEERDQDNWLYGSKGSGGENGNNPVNQLYGFYPPSRAWCDEKLLELGYILS